MKRMWYNGKDLEKCRMRFGKLQITDHAIMRWKQRIDSVNFTEEDIRRAVAESIIIKKNEPLPFATARVPNTIYSFYNSAMFIMQPLDINEYNLITVVTKSNNYNFKFKKSKFKPFDFVKKIEPDEKQPRKRYRRSRFNLNKIVE